MLDPLVLELGHVAGAAEDKEWLALT